MEAVDEQVMAEGKQIIREEMNGINELMKGRE